MRFQPRGPLDLPLPEYSGMRRFQNGHSIWLILFSEAFQSIPPDEWNTLEYCQVALVLMYKRIDQKAGKYDFEFIIIFPSVLSQI